MVGGEVYVKKIPSMNILDIAKSVSADMPLRVIGIRPGEKLHEIMITSDDSRTTHELPDRYVIEPSYNFWEPQDVERYKQYKIVKENFSYTSC